MKIILLFIFLIPLLATCQPFKIKEVRIRHVNVNNYAFYDIHAVLIAKKGAETFNIDSLLLNQITSNGLKVSVLGKSLLASDFVKGDSVLIQCNVPVADSLQNSSISLYYHINKKPDKPKHVSLENFKILSGIIYQNNQ